MDIFDPTALPPDLRRKLQKAKEDPRFFTENFLTDPNSDKGEKLFQANTPQKEIFASKKLSTWICVHRRAGKELPHYEVVYTPSGPVKVGELNVGDRVCIPSGGTAEIIDITEPNLSEVWRLTLSDNTHIDCNKEHEWFVFLPERSESVTVTTKQLSEILKETPARIYNVKPAFGDERDLKIDPYKFAFTAKGFIPQDYLYSSVNQRALLLKGFVDAQSAKVVDDRLNLKFHCSRLSWSVAELARTLGAVVFVKGGDLEIILPKDLPGFSGVGKKVLFRDVVSVERTRNETVMSCITVDHKDHLFITSGHTPTHNCLTYDNYVLNPETLRPIRINEAENFEKTLAFDFDTNKVEETECSWNFNGVKTCVKLYLGTGVAIGLSTDHEIFEHKKGWIPAGELKIGDKILAPSKMPCGEEEAGEGSCSLFAKITMQDDRVPDEVFKLNEKSLSLYLKELFGVFGKVLSRRCEYRLLKKSLAFDVQHLLLRLGIESRVDKCGILNIENSIDTNTFLVKVLNLDVPLLDVRSSRRWEIVVDIQNLGSRKVFDLSVFHPDFNFISNNTVVHNSYSFTALALWYAVTQENKQIIIFFPGTKQEKEFFDIIDKWINVNELLQAFKSPTGNTKDPQQRSFITGTTITGQILSGTTIRGLTADIVFVDEAQELDEDDWRQVDPIILGDFTRRGKVKAWIAGTLYAPEGKYYETIRDFKNSGKKPPNSDVIFLPITQNADYLPEDIEEMQAKVTPGSWRTEYLLEVGDADTSVFSVDTLNDAFFQDYEPGPHMIRENCVRFLTIDWDKYQCGTNILITQYDPNSKTLELLHHEEVKDPIFTYITAVNRAVALWQEFRCRLLIADKGAGEGQLEMLMEAGMKNPGIELLENIVPVSYRQNVELQDPNSEEVLKENIKSFLVGRLKLKLQRNQVRIPHHKKEIYDQFLGFKVVKQTDNTVTYSKKNEHIVDCFLFAVYGVHLMYEDEFLDYHDASMSGEIMTYSHQPALHRGFEVIEDDDGNVMSSFPLRSNINVPYRRSLF